MNRNEIARQLHLMVDARLFGTAAWPVDRESADRLQTTLLRMGLVKEVPGVANTWRNTPLGNADSVVDHLRRDALISRPSASRSAAEPPRARRWRSQCREATRGAWMSGSSPRMKLAARVISRLYACPALQGCSPWMILPAW